MAKSAQRGSISTLGSWGRFRCSRCPRHMPRVVRGFVSEQVSNGAKKYPGLDRNSEAVTSEVATKEAATSEEVTILAHRCKIKAISTYLRVST